MSISPETFPQTDAKESLAKTEQQSLRVEIEKMDTLMGRFKLKLEPKDTSWPGEAMPSSVIVSPGLGWAGETSKAEPEAMIQNMTRSSKSRIITSP